MCILNKNISQITIPKTDFYLREELELFEYPSKCSLPIQHFLHHCHYCHCQFGILIADCTLVTSPMLWSGEHGRTVLSWSYQSRQASALMDGRLTMVKTTCLWVL